MKLLCEGINVVIERGIRELTLNFGIKIKSTPEFTDQPPQPRPDMIIVKSLRRAPQL